MDYINLHFERFSCGVCALTMIEVLHWTFAHKASSFSTGLYLHAAKPDVTFHGNHTHTTCSHMCSHRNAQECASTSDFTIVNETAMSHMQAVTNFVRKKDESASKTIHLS